MNLFPEGQEQPALAGRYRSVHLPINTNRPDTDPLARIYHAKLSRGELSRHAATQHLSALVVRLGVAQLEAEEAQPEARARRIEIDYLLAAEQADRERDEKLAEDRLRYDEQAKREAQARESANLEERRLAMEQDRVREWKEKKANEDRERERIAMEAEAAAKREAQAKADAEKKAQDERAERRRRLAELTG